MQKQASSTNKNQINTKLLSRVEKVAKNRTRTVRLKVRLSCGCGNIDDMIIEREVPYDDPIQDGTVISSGDVQLTDVWI